MNLLKSIFISSYMMAIMGIAGYAGWMLYQGESLMAWGGVLLTVAPILTVIMRAMMLKDMARTSAHFPLINLLGLAGTALAGFGGPSTGAATLLAVVGWVAFLLYSYWFSTYGDRQPSMKLVVGSKLPHFTVRDVNDNIVSSAQLTNKPAILIFYRGNWCPFCTAQIKELMARYKQLDALGVRVALIAPQPHENTVGVSKTYDAKFDFLTDEENAAARALGIEHKNGLPMGMQALGYDSDTVMPTVIITGKDGKIVWTHETDNYRVRPEPDTFLEVLRLHGVVTA
ncbi:peroxiredoxin family protein [Gallionella capsiferriformans]|uniref:thioredoxin-dependent peroxiredoxin n=1 Tax=Gallionella capsiferriformans (strain ES-2) TaxID=395494 RepID=D9SHE1_GALCS|nr:peroxiredoxin-like family protein [Gallionella capsiferriformans]ADL55938.1 alkyl hydroperoxide reductase/ Thiol specific antioxidant/ Mal allergen [Gallionella capsiferriformans ES-2]